MTVPGRRTRFGLVVAGVVCALSTGCTVGTAERAAAPDGPVAAADDVAADPVVAEPSAGDRTSEVTTIAPYSLRARPEPTVSTPVTWDEVETCSGDGVELRFEAGDVLARVDELGDLFEPVLTTEQHLPAPG